MNQWVFKLGKRPTAIYVAVHACAGYAKKAEKIGKVIMRKVANKHIIEN